jgi:hypothetical protein
MEDVAVSDKLRISGSRTMKTVSVRTLALLLELLLAVVSYQYLSVARAKTPDAVWLAGDHVVVRPNTWALPGGMRN